MPVCSLLCPMPCTVLGAWQHSVNSCDAKYQGYKVTAGIMDRSKLPGIGVAGFRVFSSVAGGFSLSL